MRGLNTRVLLAKTRILFLVDAAAANKQMDKVRNLAEADGWQDAANDITVVPMLFKDEPNLAYNWARGQERYFDINFDLFYDAEAQGISDHQNGITEPDQALLDQPHLMRCWQKGRRFAAALEVENASADSDVSGPDFDVSERT